MDYDAQVDAVEREAAALVAAVGTGPIDAPVPTCPSWTVDDLAAHVGEFCGLWTHVLCEASGREKTPYSVAVGDEGRVAWLDALTRHLVSELRATSGDAPAWTWHEPDQTAGFVGRRCCHELTIHRADAQAARGPVDPIPAAVAIDGIEEILFLVSVGGPDGEAGGHGTGETLHLHGTDNAAEWLLTLTPTGVDVAREHAKGDLELRGAVGDLELLLYQRPTAGEVQRFGDEAVLEAFYREFTFA